MLSEDCGKRLYIRFKLTLLLCVQLVFVVNYLQLMVLDLDSKLLLVDVGL